MPVPQNIPWTHGHVRLVSRLLSSASLPTSLFKETFSTGEEERGCRQLNPCLPRPAAAGPQPSGSVPDPLLLGLVANRELPTGLHSHVGGGAILLVHLRCTAGEGGS